MPDQRDLRLRLDAREDPHRLRPQADASWSGTRASSGRKEVYADYKAQRAARPDLLREQWPHLEPLVEAFGYQNIKVEGFEADDVIATLAERAKRAGIDVMVVTGDRDMFQLVERRQCG